MSSYISLKRNGRDIEDAYNRLKNKEVIEASEIAYFNKVPALRNIIDIDIGCDGTTNSVLRLSDDGFVVVDGV